MISQRIKQARLAAGLSMDEAVAVLAQNGVSLTKAALSKYERGRSTPKASLLQVLGKAFQVAPEFFLREHEADVVWYAYRRRLKLGAKEREHIQAMAEKRVDNFLWLRRALNMENAKPFPSRIPVATLDEAENAAVQLREAWGLGDMPIESLIEALEDCDCIVVDVPGDHKDFDGLAGVANQTYAVLVTRQDAAIDRKRFTTAHELGHLVMDTTQAAAGRDEERLANRFAAAFLVPGAVAYRELGQKRSHLSFDELKLLAEKHGLSVQAWIYRARDLRIIDEGHYNTLCMRLSASGLRKVELVRYKGNEHPARFELMVRRGLSEGLIDKDQAIRWCPDIKESVGVLPVQDLGPRAVFALPQKQRMMILREAAASVADLYQAGSETLVEDAVDHLEGSPHAGQ